MATPSSINMISGSSFSSVFILTWLLDVDNHLVQMYPDPIEQAKKLALTGMAGALTNIMALVLGVSSSLHLGGGTSGLSVSLIRSMLNQW